ncbi:MAG: alanine racemase [Rikenellaceae bacterium]
MKNYLSAIAELCEGDFLGVDSLVSNVVCDSRNHSFSSDSIFVAIKGENHNGHNYIAEMYKKGVRAFLVEREFDTSAFAKAGFVVVDNALKALQRLAEEYRKGFSGRVLAITGSNGKTVVKEWLTQIIQSKFKVFRSPKSYNSQLGVALSLLMAEGDEDIIIIEAGISKEGEMSKLERMIKPDFGIITTLGDAHQENFKSLSDKLDEKLLLFKDTEKIFYNSDYSLIDSKLRGIGEDVKGTVVASPFEDRASKENIAMCAGVLTYLGFSKELLEEKIKNLQAVAMRLELKSGINNSLIINDSYNSDINSLSIALDYLSHVAAHRKKVVILSDLLQSGMTKEDLYAKVAEKIKKYKVDTLIGIGAQIFSMAHLFECKKEFYTSSENFLASLKRSHTASKAILIKGNRTLSFERLSYALEQKSHTTTLEVNLSTMIENLNYYRGKLAEGTQLMAMVKASSYGHGAGEIALALQHEGVHFLAVAFADEGVELRQSGVSMPIVVLNADEDSFEVMITSELEPEIYNFSSLNSFIETASRYGVLNYPVHLKFDTGMGRLGFENEDIKLLAEILLSNRDVVNVKSIFSHFAVSDEPMEDDFTYQQLELFKNYTAHLIDILGYKPLLHIANTAAIERLPETHFDMCRLGIGLYTHSFISKLKTRIVHLKTMNENQSVGYGREGKIMGQRQIATIPIGYADGLNRKLGNGAWSVKVAGCKVPIIGRICMDTCMLDVTGLDIKIGDEVVIFGTDKGNTVDDMARVLDTISYEIMTSISSRVKRIYIKE